MTPYAKVSLPEQSAASNNVGLMSMMTGEHEIFRKRVMGISKNKVKSGGID